MATPLEEKYKKTLLAAKEKIQALQEELATRAAPAIEPIAVVGMSCRFPGGADNCDLFRDFLLRGGDGVVPVPDSRWDVDAFHDPEKGRQGKAYNREIALLEGDISLFDPNFFQVSPAEALAMDPQQRMLLETSWRAFEDSGIDPVSLRGSDTGVFVALSTVDYVQSHVCSSLADRIDPYSLTGCMGCSTSGRLSYFYDFTGPSVVFDAACSSSLVAMHDAVRALRQHDCALALVGAANLILSPGPHVALCAIHALAEDGRCKAFSDGADGFGRGEGCGVLVLKRLSEARREGNRIHALVLGSAVGHDGKSNGFTAPNGPAQQKIIRRALADAKVSPDEIGYVETHGTGTPLGDPIEVSALSAVFAGRSEKLRIGAVKSNVGHLEDAAGMAGLIKTIIALRDARIPPSIHCQPLAKNINWNALPVRVVAAVEDWDSPERIAGVSAFGITGTGGHVVLSSYAPEIEPDPEQTPVPGWQVLPLSAPNQDSLRELVGEYVKRLAGLNKNDFPAFCTAAGVSRTPFPARLAVSVQSPDEARALLAGYLEDKKKRQCVIGRDDGAGIRSLFLFGGQGSQQPGMGKELYESNSTFREVLDRCEQIAAPLLGVSLLETMFAEGEDSQLHQTRFTQPAIYVMQMALVAYWRSLGVTPFAVLGHSIGEYAAAATAGVFSLEDGLRAVIRRGELAGAVTIPGAMAAVLGGETQVREIMQGREGVDIAAINGLDNVVISGERGAVTDLLTLLERQGIPSRPMPVSHSFHSPLVDGVLTDFRSFLGGMKLERPKLPWISCMSAEVKKDVSAEYFCQQMRFPVRFYDALQTAASLNPRAFLEIGAAPTLTSLGRQCVDLPDCKWLFSLSGQGDSYKTISLSLAQLFVIGAKVNWQAYSPSNRITDLAVPGVCFQRKSYFLKPYMQLPGTHETNSTAGAAQIPKLSGLVDVSTAAAVMLMQDRVMRELAEEQLSVLESLMEMSL
jgi:acyl transferase domain-containing protein